MLKNCLATGAIALFFIAICSFCSIIPNAILQPLIANATELTPADTTELTSTNTAELVSTNATELAPANAKSVEPSTLAQVSWQRTASFPTSIPWDNLALDNSMSFQSYSGQGKMWISIDSEVTDFRLFFNNHEIDTAPLKPGKAYQIDLSDYAINDINSLIVSSITPASLRGAITIHVPYPEILDAIKTVNGNIDSPMAYNSAPPATSVNTVTLTTSAKAPTSVTSVISDTTPSLSTAFTAIDRLISAEVARGFPGAQLAVVKDGQLIYQNQWGVINTDPTVDQRKVTSETLYDLGGLTGCIGTTFAIQYLVDQGQLSLDTPIVEIMGDDYATKTILIDYGENNDTPLTLAEQQEYKRQLTVRQLLAHQSGLPVGVQYYQPSSADGTTNQLYAGRQATLSNTDPTVDAANVNPASSTIDSTNVSPTSSKSGISPVDTWEQICRTPLVYRPGTVTRTSDLDYLILGFIVERVTGQDLNTFFTQTFAEPLGLSACYNPLDNNFTQSQIAATELSGNTRDNTVTFPGIRAETVWGEVHDEVAYYCMNGIAGHAGIFANATDLAKLGSCMLTGGYGLNKFFNHSTITQFTSSTTKSHFGLGWSRQGDNASYAYYFGASTPDSAFGGVGWTGPLLLIDPVNQLVVAYTTNAINTPIIDAVIDQNIFAGNHYLCDSRGFIPQLIYQNLGSTSVNLTPVLSDMITAKQRLIDEEFIPKYGRKPSASDGISLSLEALQAVQSKYYH